MVETLDSILNAFYLGIHIPIRCLNFKRLSEILYFCNCYNHRVLTEIFHSLFPTCTFCVGSGSECHTAFLNLITGSFPPMSIPRPTVMLTRLSALSIVIGTGLHCKAWQAGWTTPLNILIWSFNIRAHEASSIPGVYVQPR